MNRSTVAVLAAFAVCGATWRDPDLVQEWFGELSKSDPVVVFCVYGFHAGCKIAITLRAAGSRRHRFTMAGTWQVLLFSQWRVR